MKTDFLVIGSGISGLNFALNAAQKGKVIIVTKKKIIDAGTNYAQGGIAAVLSKTDNIANHVKDTMEAGAWHNNKKAVTFMVKNSSAAIKKLMTLGVNFEMENNQLKLTKEGGHHKRRIAYVGDYTGKEVETVLVKRVKENKNITVLENTFALNLLVKNKTCFGAQVIKKAKKTAKNIKIENIFAKKTILATGGIGQLFKHTTNPSISTGDGIALGINAGCKTKDMEFIQFHPTALDKKLSPLFLMSETLRGEGAILVNNKGEKFMKNRHLLKDLAPRDVVAREIYQQLKKGPVYLDIRHKSSEFLKKRFPQIHEKLKEISIDMSKDLIPVTPAAHYLCGGIVTDLHGKTGIKNLFAFGEVTCTGVHGANRLASNSLLEALVFSNQIIKNLGKSTSTIAKSVTGDIFSYNPYTHVKNIPGNAFGVRNLLPSARVAMKLKHEIKNLMWEYAGIIRNCKKIKKEAIPKMRKIEKKLDTIKTINQEIAEARNMAKVGLLILKAAAKRKKSLGCHFML
ncbi:L-aspartate oxidase [Candidatus Peregrinibacteria bacterium]|nr:L-aspartate oxidase [Candidatus Peregrinibacteria bacterium]